MPWTKRNYPNAMKNLSAEVRGKAIEIANALLEERNMAEDIAIATGISHAKDWAVNRGKESEDATGASHTTDIKHHEEDRYVMPDKNGRVVKAEARSEKKHFETKNEAVENVKKEAKKNNASVTVQGKTGKIQS